MTTHETITPAAPDGQRGPGQPVDTAHIRHTMHDDASLAKLFRDYGQQWEIEKIDRGAEWLAYQRDNGGHLTLVVARDLAALRFKLTQAGQRDAGEQDAS